MVGGYIVCEKKKKKQLQLLGALQTIISSAQSKANMLLYQLLKLMPTIADNRTNIELRLRLNISVTIAYSI